MKSTPAKDKRKGNEKMGSPSHLCYSSSCAGIVI
jgi:hypothetical protein